MLNKSFYLISNSNVDSFPNNTLTKFSNKFPEELNLSKNKKCEIALEALGFSCNFRNIELPPNSLPSIIITDSTVNKLDVNQTKYLPQSGLWDIPIPKFQYDTQLDGGNWYFYRFQEKYYNEQDINDKLKTISDESNIDMHITNEKELFIGNKGGSGSFWILLHPTIMKSLRFWPSKFLEHSIHDNTEIYVAYAMFGLAKTVMRKTYYGNEMYYLFNVENNYLMGQKMKKKPLPHLIKVKCNQIQPQVLNSVYSKDLTVFCPDLKANQKTYFFKEFKTKQYLQLENTVFSQFDIQLHDETDNQLQLLPGAATILKVHIREMENENSFAFRLTSNKNTNYPSNKNNKFKVKLAKTYTFNRSWKAALVSINHPNEYSTFLENEATRKVIIQLKDYDFRGDKTYSTVLDNIVYTKETLIDTIDDWFRMKDVGAIDIHNGKVRVTMKKELNLKISTYLAQILGYDKRYDPSKPFVSIMFMVYPADRKQLEKDENGFFVIRFLNPIDIDLLKPNYIIVYTNFISSTIIGGTYSKILRVLPIQESDKTYALSESHNKEFCELENTELSEIEIELRSHDGELINFCSDKEVILNIEFTKDSNH